MSTQSPSEFYSAHRSHADQLEVDKGALASMIRHKRAATRVFHGLLATLGLGLIVGSAQFVPPYTGVSLAVIVSATLLGLAGFALFFVNLLALAYIE